jgi:hypothetical protein
MKKYKAIYKVIHESNDTTMKDMSNWHRRGQSLIDIWQPLWIILENRRVNLRLWITHNHGELRITTAQLDLNCKSREYSESYRRYQ